MDDIGERNNKWDIADCMLNILEAADIFDEYTYYENNSKSDYENNSELDSES